MRAFLSGQHLQKGSRNKCEREMKQVIRLHRFNFYKVLNFFCYAASQKLRSLPLQRGRSHLKLMVRNACVKCRCHGLFEVCTRHESLNNIFFRSALPGRGNILPGDPCILNPWSSVVRQRFLPQERGPERRWERYGSKPATRQVPLILISSSEQRPSLARCKHLTGSAFSACEGINVSD